MSKTIIFFKILWELVQRLFKNPTLKELMDYFLKMTVLVYFAGQFPELKKYLFTLQAYYTFRLMIYIWNAIRATISGFKSTKQLGKEMREFQKAMGDTGFDIGSLLFGKED